MSERHFKWRDVSKASQTSSRLVLNPKQLPERFRPRRERSESVDRIFNGSRSKVLSSSSLDHSVNRDAEPLLPEQSLARWQEHKEEALGSLRQEVMRLNTLELGVRQTSSGKKEEVNWSRVLAQVKKEFMNFKQNVLQELQRQKQIVDQLIKQVVLTVEYELSRLSKGASQNPSSIKSCQSTVDYPEVKTLKNWKQILKGINFSPPPKSSSVTGTECRNSSKQQSSSSQVSKELLAPPAKLEDMSLLASSLGRLKQQVMELDSILGIVPTEQGGGVGGTK